MKILTLKESKKILTEILTGMGGAYKVGVLLAIIFTALMLFLGVDLPRP